MSENKKGRFQFRKGGLNIDLHLGPENKGWATGWEEGHPVLVQPAATGACSHLTCVVCSSFAFKSQLSGSVNVE